MKILWVDTETTGCEPGVHGVTHVAGIVDIDGKVVQEFEFLCRPYEGQQYTAKAMEITGRTIEEVKGFADPLVVHKSLKEILSKHVNPYSKDVNQRFVIGGQNIEFDYKMMEAFFAKAGDRYWYSWCDRRGIDLIQASVLFRIAGRLDLPNVKLETVAAALGVPLVAHDAMNDIRATRECYYKLAEMLKVAA